MFRLLLLLFIIVPLVEFYLLYTLAVHTSFLFTLGVVIFTGMLGAWLAKREGYRTWSKIHEELGRGQMPSSALLDALMIFVAGALLVTPGVLTDLFGFSLLMPPCRAFYKLLAQRYFRANFQVQGLHFSQSGESGPPAGRSQIIDSYVVEHHEEK